MKPHWVRFWTPPRLKPTTDLARKVYLSKKSHARYLLTSDGIEMTEIMKDVLEQGAIGMYHGIIIHEN